MTDPYYDPYALYDVSAQPVAAAPAAAPAAPVEQPAPAAAAPVESAAPAAGPEPVPQEAAYDPYVAYDVAPQAPPAATTPQDAPTQPTPEAAAPEQAAPADPQPATYTPGTNRIIDTLMGAGDRVGDVIEQVGGPELRKNLSGFAPPVVEVAQAPTVLDKVSAASNYWDRTAEQGQESVGDQAIAAQEQGQKAGSEPYSLTSKEGLGQALGQFGDQVTDYIAHPEHILSAIPEDSAEGDTVFGDQGFNDWAAQHQDDVAAANGDGDALYQAYLQDTGYTWDSGLGGLGKGIVQQSLTDEALLPSIALGGASNIAKGAAHADDLGVARGILTSAADAANRVVQGPEDLLLDKGASLLTKVANKVPGLRSLFNPSPSTGREMASQAYDEITQDVATSRGGWLNEAPAATRTQTPTAPQTAQTAPVPATDGTGPSARTTQSTAPAAPSSPPTVGAPIGGRGQAPDIISRPGRASGAEWVVEPADGQTFVDGRTPTRLDLKAAATEWTEIPPGTIKGFDQPELGGYLPEGARSRNQAQMRAGLTQGLIDEQGVKTPYLADDISRARMKEDLNLSPGRIKAGARYIHYQAQRINRFGDEEVSHLLQKMQQDKYRGVRGNTQPYEVWWDNKRLAIADAIRASNFERPVDLGYRHKFDPATGRYVVDTHRPIRVNPDAAGKALNIGEFEPDLATWQAIQQSALMQGNPPQFRVVTPPPAGQTPAPAALQSPLPPQGPAGSAPTTSPLPRTRPVKAGFEDDEFDGILVAEGHKPALRTPVKDRTLFRVVTDTQDDVRTLADVATGRQHLPQEMVDNLTQTYTQQFKDLYGKDLEPDFATMTPQELDTFAANIAHKQWYDSLPPLEKKTSNGLAAGLLQANSDIISFRSAVGLHNWAAAPRQMVVQTTGNLWTAFLTKPSAITGMIDPRRWKQIFQMDREARLNSTSGPFRKVAKSTTMSTMERMGLGTNGMINPDVMKSLAGSTHGIHSPALNKAKGIVAPDFLRDLAALPDGVARDAITAVDWTPNVRRLQKGLGKESQTLASDWVRKGKLAVPPTEVKKAVNGALNAHFTGSSRVSEISPVELEQALLKHFEGTANQTGLVQFADRIARDYKTKLNTIQQNTARETRRVLFSWDPNRIDDAARQALLYHYWTSRASGLYIKTMITNPWMAGNLVRLAQAAHDEATSNDYPLWMQGMSRLMSSPAGVVMLANPFTMFSAALFFADWQYGADPMRLGQDLTQIGNLRGIFPMMINPLIDSAAWALGLYGGEDAGRLINEPTGAERIPRDLIRILNLARLNGDLPPGMLSDESGNPQLLPERPLTELWTKFTSSLAGVVREDPQPIPNLYASISSGEQAHLLDILVEDHPDWPEDLITREMNRQVLAAEDGTAPPELIEAQKRYLEGQLRGPEFQFLPPALQGVVGAVLRNVSPMQMMTRPEMQTALLKTPYGVPGRAPQALPEMRDPYDHTDMAGAIYNTPEMTEFNSLAEDWWGDPGLDTADDKYYAITKAENPNGETVGGVHYSQEQIMAMTDQRRYRLAREALEAEGYDTADLDARTAMRSAIEESNTDLAAFKGYVDAAKNDPQGIEHFVDTLYASDPAFQRMMDQVPYPKGSSDWYGAFKWTSTFFGAEGNKTSNYDPETVPEGDLPTAQYISDREATRADAAENAPLTIRTERAVNELMAAQDMLDAEYPDYGYVVGRGNLPSDVWNHMRPIWEGAEINTTFITKPSHYGQSYVDWLGSNPGGTVQDFLDATLVDDGSNKFANGAVPGEESSQSGASTQSKPVDLNAPLDYGRVAARYGVATPAAAGTRMSYTDSPLDLRQSPGGASLGVIGPTIPLRILEINGDWAHVAAPGGYEGYVPTMNLRK